MPDGEKEYPRALHSRLGIKLHSRQGKANSRLCNLIHYCFIVTIGYKHKISKEISTIRLVILGKIFSPIHQSIHFNFRKAYDTVQRMHQSINLNFWRRMQCARTRAYGQNLFNSHGAGYLGTSTENKPPPPLLTIHQAGRPVVSHPL
jgi:hypothetical protein